MRWTTNRIYSNTTNAIVLKNQNVGTAWNVSGTLEKNFRAGFWFKGGYRYGEAKNTVDPGSIAAARTTATLISGDPNNPGLSYSAHVAGPPRVRDRQLPSRVLQLRRDVRVGLLGRLHERQHELRTTRAT